MTEYSQPKAMKLTIREGDAPFLMSRVTTKRPSVPIIKADISSISVTIHSVIGGTPAVVLAATALDKATVWFDTLQTTDDWTDTQDAIGYNFGWQSLASYFIATGLNVTMFRVEVRVIPVSGQALWAGWWDVTTIPAQSM